MQPYTGLERWARAIRLPESGIELFLYDTGGQPNAAAGETPVLLLHGLGDEADTWRHVLAQIGDRDRVRDRVRAVAPDLPGFGRSDKGKHPYTIPFFAKVIIELLDALGLPRVVLGGHSTGAVIAQTVALEHPERVVRLVLIGGSLAAGDAKLDLSLLMFLIPRLGEWAYSRLRKDPQAAYASLAPYYHDLEALPKGERDFLYQRVNERVWSDGQRRGFLSTLRGLARWLPAQQKTLSERLRGWSIPTTVLWGEDDRIMPAAAARALQERIPSAQVITVPGAGHNLQQEKPASVIEALGF